jgi:hypothetical protein
MASHSRTAPREDADGVRVLTTPGARLVAWLAASAMLLVVVATLVAWFVLRSDAPRAAAPPAGAPVPGTLVAAAPIAAPAATAPAHPIAPPAKPPPIARRRTAPASTPPGVSPPAAAGSGDAKSLDAAPVIRALQAAGETEGIAAFGVPGTNPPKSGIIVPDDFELPEGYVRHHQVTDEGEQLPAILMFHPDYEFVDEHGAPVAVPADRIVPPEMAPPGLAIHMLDVPRAGRTP